MKKEPVAEAAPQRFIRPHAYKPRFSLYLTALAAGCLIYHTLTAHGTWFPLHGGHPTPHHGSSSNADFSWTALPSTPYLDYTPCYGDFQCARLELPMDYWNGTTNATVSIAVVKKPAAVPVTHPRYGGAVLHNPGGPGGSGVGFLLGAGAALQEIVGSPTGLQFDHISFDPRGIAFSTPLIRCFSDPAYEAYWQARVVEEGLYSSSDAAFGRLWSIAVAEAGSCSLPPEDGSVDIKQYVNTAFVARDMLEIVERHGKWREAEARRLLRTSRHCKGSNASDVIDTLKFKPGREKINYWGFSYGTYLGNTFAAMFPDRVHRLIVDGVVDAYDYRKALWLENLVDTEKDLNLFYYHCARVGYPKCALANDTGKTTSEGVEARVKNITTGLYHNPLPIISRDRPGIITYSDIKGFLFAALYSPIPSFPIVADVLAEIESGNFILAEQLSERGLSILGSSSSSSGTTERPANQNELYASAIGQSATIAIACSDGDDQTHTTKAEFREHIRRLERQSPNLGEIWAFIRLGCIHYKVRAHHRFTADWVARTAHPILEIGNTADPVTPGRYAEKMARGFEGAVALMQDSPGHCSLAAVSACTIGYVRGYFQTGELPPPGTVCPVDEVPFGEEGEEVSGGEGAGEGVRLREMYAEAARSVLASQGGFGGLGLSGLMT